MRRSSSSGVSCLICTYNGASRLAETLTCLARQVLPAGTPWEVILVDNASTDATVERARQLWHELGSPGPLHLLHEQRPGKQYALETAIAQVQYAYTCIVDDDNRLAPDYLRIGLELLTTHPRIGILGGPNTATFEGAEPAWFSAFQHCYAVGPQLNRIGGSFAPLADGCIGQNVLWGAGMFVQTAIWDSLREIGFQSMFSGRQGEANLTAGEDDELCYAAQLLGYEVWYSSRLHLQHHMTAARLTETYRNRLFYASAYSTARLDAYRNALWGKPNGTISTNLLKDISYKALDLAKAVFSWKFAKSFFTNDTLMQMNRLHVATVIKASILHYGQVKAYYQQALKVKQQARAASSRIQSATSCIN